MNKKIALVLMFSVSPALASLEDGKPVNFVLTSTSGLESVMIKMDPANSGSYTSLMETEKFNLSKGEEMKVSANVSTDSMDIAKKDGVWIKLSQPKGNNIVCLINGNTKASVDTVQGVNTFTLSVTPGDQVECAVSKMK